MFTFGDLLSRQKTGKAFLTVEDEAIILSPSSIAGADHIAALSSDGRVLVFPLDQIKRLSGGKGVQIIGLRNQETLKSAIPIQGTVTCITGTWRNRPKEFFSEEKHFGQRARRGAVIGSLNNPALKCQEKSKSG